MKISRSNNQGIPQPARRKEGFSLLEVLIATAIFFMAVFVVLQVTSQNLGYARNLQRIPVDASSLAAQYTLTNAVEEGIESGDFGEDYPDYSWTREVFEVNTNGLFQADFRVYSDRKEKSSESTMSILLYRPDAAGTSSRLRGRGGRR